MKRCKNFMWVPIAAFCLAFACQPVCVRAEGSDRTGSVQEEQGSKSGASDRILEGVRIGNIQVGGLTKEEAEKAVSDFITELGAQTMVLQITDIVGNAERTVRLSDFGITWRNPEILDEALTLARRGNIIRRYKAAKDVENGGTAYLLKLKADRNTVSEALRNGLSEMEIPMSNAGLSLPDGGDGFVISEGQAGRSILYEETAAALVDFLENEWLYEDGLVFQVMTECVPVEFGSDICRLVGRNAMASFSTDYGFSTEERGLNIANAASKINGTVVYPGKEFSTLKTIAPFTGENGYYEAGSYFHGKLADSFGGGVCQVSSALYNAVLLGELEVTKRSNHGLTVDYVQLSADAAIAESSGMDFCFKNNTDAPILIRAYVSDKVLTVELYGHDTRPQGRTISYVHEITEEYEPGEDIFEEDPELLEGTTEVKQKAHKGYKVILYKNVYVNGALTEHIKVNESEYKASPRYIAVGTAKEK